MIIEFEICNFAILETLVVSIDFLFVLSALIMKFALRRIIVPKMQNNHFAANSFVLSFSMCLLGLLKGSNIETSDFSIGCYKINLIIRGSPTKYSIL